MVVKRADGREHLATYVWPFGLKVWVGGYPICIYCNNEICTSGVYVSRGSEIKSTKVLRSRGSEVSKGLTVPQR